MTIKQKQCLLFYLGYYVGNVDSVWGAMSKTATKAFQKDFGLKDTGNCDAETEQALKHAVCYGISKKQEAAQSNDFWSGIKYFQRSEFRCKCGCGADNMEEKLIREAEDVRVHFGAPVTVSSGRRCKNHNARVGGVANSRHLSGKAMDFCVKGKSSQTVLEYVQKKPNIRYAYAIDGSYVHMDVN
jgi:uncharacterized protein YcbK (DUF882 family)